MLFLVLFRYYCTIKLIINCYDKYYTFSVILNYSLGLFQNKYCSETVLEKVR